MHRPGRFGFGFLPLATALVFLMGGCAGTSGSIEGTWKTTTGGMGDRDEMWFDFEGDRTGDFHGATSASTDFIWTRFDGVDQLQDFIARTGVSLRESVRDGTPLPYSPDGAYLALIDTTASKGFPLMRIVSLDRSQLVVEFEGSGTILSMERVD